MQRAAQLTFPMEEGAAIGLKGKGNKFPIVPTITLPIYNELHQWVTISNAAVAENVLVAIFGHAHLVSILVCL